MLGYVNINKEKLSANEKGLFQTFMCGICIATKEHYGLIERNIITNDVNILGILAHSFLGVTPQMYSANCISSPLRKRTIFRTTELFERLAAANVILCYANLLDDCVDSNSLRKKTAVKVLKKSYLKAKEILPLSDGVVSSEYAKLKQLEKQNCSTLDQVCECSANMLVSIMKSVVPSADARLLNMCYNLGKWVYLIDALDDLSKDIRKHNYNPLLAYFHTNTAQDVTTKEAELEFIFYSTLNQIATDYNDLNLQNFRCVLDNVIYHGIREKTQEVFAKYKKEKK